MLFGPFSLLQPLVLGHDVRSAPPPGAPRVLGRSPQFVGDDVRSRGLFNRARPGYAQKLGLVRHEVANALRSFFPASAFSLLPV
jgi:hypothetical protein